MFTESINIIFYIDFNNITLFMIFIKMLEYNISYMLSIVYNSPTFSEALTAHTV